MFSFMKDFRYWAIPETKKERTARKAVERLKRQNTAIYLDKLVKDAGPPLPGIRLETFAIVLDRRKRL
jgi:hypothetical protein